MSLSFYDWDYANDTWDNTHDTWDVPGGSSATTIPLATTFNIQPQNYNGLQLTWLQPAGSWNEQVLIRSSFGTPISCYGTAGNVASSDGTILLDQIVIGVPAILTYTDTGLQSGQFYYYSLFVFNTLTAQYQLVGACQGLCLSPFGSGNSLLAFLPDWYEFDDQMLATIAEPEGPLQRFLNLLGYEMDWIRSEMETMFLFTNTKLISGALLPILGNELGVLYEPELGMQRSRVIVENAIYLFKTKGTATGIAAAASAYSGYGCEVTIGKNLALQLDDGAFDRSFGLANTTNAHWVAGNAFTTITGVVNAGKIGVTPPHDSYVPVTTAIAPAWVSNFAYPVNQLVSYSGLIYVSQYSVTSTVTPALDTVNWFPVSYLPYNNWNVGEATASGGALALTTCTPATVLNLGIPVLQTATPPTYVVSIYEHPSTAATPSPFDAYTVQIDWYSSIGALISSTVGTALTENEFTWIRPYAVGSPPAGAMYLGATAKSTGTLSSGQRLFDGFQIEVNSLATPGPTAWDPPRDIKVNLFPLRQNLIPNPSGFAGTVTGWSITNGTIQSSAALATPPAVTWPAGTTTGFVITSNSNYSTINSGGYYGSDIPSNFFFGGGALIAGSGTGNNNVTVSALVPVQAGLSYTFSAYAEAATISRTVELSITFLNASAGIVGAPAFTASLTAPLVQGQSYNALQVNLPFNVAANQTLLINLGGSSQQLVTATQATSAGALVLPVETFVANENYGIGTLVGFQYIEFNDVVGSFTRGALVNIAAPLTSVQALVQATFLGVANGEVHYFGAPLMEPLPTLLPYFDANFTPSTNYLWEGTANDSISDFYLDLPTRLARLVTILPQFTPIGSTFSLVTGAQAFTNTGLIG
jgi:Phage tail protein (Tail_P2_I)